MAGLHPPENILSEMKGASKVLVFSGFSEEEIENPAFGGAKLVALQRSFFREQGQDTHLVDLERLVGPTGLALRIAGQIRRRRKKDAAFLPLRGDRGERDQWRFNLLFYLALEAFSRLDWLARRQVARMAVSGGEVLAIWNYPFGVHVLSSLRKRARGGRVRIFVYEHNVEGDFYSERIGSGRIFRFLSDLFSRVELANLSYADLVLCANPRDRDKLEAAGVDPERMVVWIPRPRLAAQEGQNLGAPRDMRERLEGRYVIGFVGSAYGPNMVAVKHIMEMAERLAPEITFLVIGSVCDWFCKQETVPENVVLCGFVEDLDAYLSLCDAFINPKTTSDTGAEMKMLDYMRHEKPVFSTVIGSRGFEDYARLIVSEIGDMPVAIRARAVHDLG